MSRQVSDKGLYPLDSLVQVVRELRGPEGCPWDQEQDHESLKRYLIEEAYEVVEAIELGDMHRLREELGDLLLQIVFHGELAQEKGIFDINDVVDDIVIKMQERHPHVFGNKKANTAAEVMDSWEKMKDAEKARRGDRETLLDVPRSLPALRRAEKIQTRASRVGFDWQEIEDVWNKFHEEKSELMEAIQQGEQKAIVDEFGDILFALVNVARFLKLDPEEALGQTINKFAKRFYYMEQRTKEQGQDLEQLSLTDMDRLWSEAKAREKINGKNY